MTIVTNQEMTVRVAPAPYPPTEIAYVEWSHGVTAPPDRVTAGRTAVLVHGALAHARWWDHLVPGILGLGFVRAIAVDLSGHGHSAWTGAYSRDAWAHELVDLIDRLGIPSDSAVVGHSLGGTIALAASRLAPDRWRDMILIDSVLHWGAPPPSGTHRSPFTRRPSPGEGEVIATHRHFPSREAAAARFRLVPEQELPDSALRTRIAEQSVRFEAGRGWTWRFDPRLLGKRPDGPLAWPDGPAPEHLAYIRGGLSTLVPQARFDEVAARLRPGRAVSVPGAHHHVILDHPDEVITALGTVL